MVEVEIVVSRLRKKGKPTLEYCVYRRGVAINRIVGSTRKRSKQMLNDYISRNNMVITKSMNAGGK